MRTGTGGRNNWKRAFWIEFVVFCCFAILMGWLLVESTSGEFKISYAENRIADKDECIQAMIDLLPYLNLGLPVSDLADTLAAAFPDRSIAFTGRNGIVVGNCGLVFDAQGKLVLADHWIYSIGD